jgi:hypothetical protein
MPETLYELPAMDDFALTADEGQVWLQCRICLQTTEVGSLAECIERWNEHICKERQPLADPTPVQ